jgi:hypothetical protein
MVSLCPNKSCYEGYVTTGDPTILRLSFPATNNNVAYLIKARSEKPSESAVAREQLCKHAFC